jgi:hypothetical protein
MKLCSGWNRNGLRVKRLSARRSFVVVTLLSPHEVLSTTSMLVPTVTGLSVKYQQLIPVYYQPIAFFSYDFNKD